MNFHVTEGIILAAGLSTRLRSYLNGNSKLTTPILGRPLITFPIMNFISVGIRRIIIVANKDNFWAIKKIINEIPSDVNIRIVVNRKPELGNGYSFLLGRKYVYSDFFVLSMGDHIYVPRVLRTLLNALSNDVDIVLGADSSPRFIEVAEATKILVFKDRVIGIGKKLGLFSHVDIGVMLIRKKLFEFLDEYKIKSPIGLSEIINLAIRRGFRVRIADVNGDFWTEVDTPSDLRQVLIGERKVVVQNLIQKLKPLLLSSYMQRRSQIHELTE